MSDGLSLEVLHTIIEERDARYGQRFSDMERALQAALASSEKAILKAETSTEKRFESVNEFRSTLSDQANQFMTRNEAQALFQRVTDRIEDMNARIDSLNSREDKRSGKSSGLNAGWVYLLGAVAAIGTIVSLMLAFRVG
jgi:tetrahydromethanopterin S-methyltransferase subunit G